MKLTALGEIAQNGFLAGKAAAAARDRFEDTGSTHHAKSAGYYEGEAAASHEAYTIMKREIERLRNRFQNGYLTMDDFGTELEQVGG